jgi:hypothetical protein
LSGRMHPDDIRFSAPGKGKKVHIHAIGNTVT